ncbi:MAG: OmpP1/FadL family transporter, partial [Planctomycetota bacterium]|jgi:long-chain fatty acid transport protein
MAIFSDIELDLGAGTVSSPPGSFDGGGNIGSFAPGLGSFIVMPLGEKLRFGFSVTALAANGVDYDDNWVGRAFVTENSIVVANFEPALAYRVNDWLSVGAGLNILYMQLNQDIKASNAADAPTIKIDEADDWEPAVTLSLLLEPSERTRIGLNYRTEAEFDLDGDLQVPIPGSLTFNGDFTLPQGFNVSLYHELNDRLAILADGGWSDWSAFGQIPTQFGPVPVLQDRGWDDTWRAAVGLQYRIDDQWLVRGGFGFDSSPLDDDKVLPDIPVGAQYRFSLGLQKNFGQGKVFGIGYTLMYTDIEIDGVPLPPNNAVVLDGEYDPAFIHVLGTYLSLTF